MRTLGAPGVTPLPKQPSNQTTAYIISAFKAEGDPERLDKMWATWSGSDFIQAHLQSELKLNRITMHKRVGLHGTFMYILMCELGAGVTYLNRARDFIERLNEFGGSSHLDFINGLQEGIFRSKYIIPLSGDGFVPCFYLFQYI